jgi:hypothetical protein
VRRESADDYARLIYQLCGMPPSEERERYAAELVTVLLGLYETHGGSAPPGLVEFARQLNSASNANVESRSD